MRDVVQMEVLDASTDIGEALRRTRRLERRAGRARRSAAVAREPGTRDKPHASFIQFHHRAAFHELRVRLQMTA